MRGAGQSRLRLPGAKRDGRRWLPQLADGAEIPVSAHFAGAARDRGWLRVRR